MAVNNSSHVGALTVDFQVQQDFTCPPAGPRQLVSLQVYGAEIVRLQESLAVQGRGTEHFVIRESATQVPFVGRTKLAVIHPTANLTQLLSQLNTHRLNTHRRLSPPNSPSPNSDFGCQLSLADNPATGPFHPSADSSIIPAPAVRHSALIEFTLGGEDPRSQCLGRVRVLHANRGLINDRTVVEFVVDKMNRAASYFAALPQNRLVDPATIESLARKGGYQAGVNVHYATLEIRRNAELSQKPAEHHIVDRQLATTRENLPAELDLISDRSMIDDKTGDPGRRSILQSGSIR